MPLPTKKNTGFYRSSFLTQITCCLWMWIFGVFDCAAADFGDQELIYTDEPIKPFNHYPAVAEGYEDIYDRFLNGKLIYRPNRNSDEGKVELRIADLADPLEGTFDLSRCGDTGGKYMSISTGYRKRKNPENATKFEIWIAPKFLIEKKLSTTAAHFEDVMNYWVQEKAQVGLFWNWGDWDDLRDHAELIDQSMDELGNNQNLHEKRRMALSCLSEDAYWPGEYMDDHCFYISFAESCASSSYSSRQNHKPKAVQSFPSSSSAEVIYPLVACEYEAIYERFLNGALVYRPTQGSDAGMVTLPIRELSNPLEGTFDLSRCWGASEDLSISTGYCKEKKPENAGKVEIWIAPRFLIEKELDTTAAHFKPIMANWKHEAQVGMFWTWGGSDNMDRYDYLINQSMSELSNGNLYEKWVASTHCVVAAPRVPCSRMYVQW